MRLAITGGAGFIGSHRAEALIGKHELVIVDDLSTGRRECMEKLHACSGVEFLDGSILDRTLLRSAFEDADGVFHLGAFVSVPGSISNPLLVHEVNLTGTLNVLIAARDAGAKRLVFASSAAVYGPNGSLPLREEAPAMPASPYAMTKLGGEHYCRLFSELYGLSTISLRYFNVYGPRQDPSSPYAAVITAFIGRLLANERPVVHGDGLQTRDFIYVKDVARANMLAMDSKAQGVYNIASGRSTGILELGERLAHLLCIKFDPLFAPPRLGDIRHSVASVEKARDALGFSPMYTLEKGLMETIAWFREESVSRLRR